MQCQHLLVKVYDRRCTRHASVEVVDVPRGWEQVADLSSRRLESEMALGWQGAFFLAADSELMAAEVNGSGSAFQIASVRPLFHLPS